MTTDALEKRMERLERRNNLLSIGLIATLMTAIFAATTADNTDLIQAKRFELVDASGGVRATLAVSDDGSSGLYVMDDSSRVRLSASHGPDETALFIRDRAGDTRVGVAQFAHGGGGFALHGKQLKGATVLYMRDGKGSLTHFDEQGEITFRVPAE